MESFSIGTHCRDIEPRTFAHPRRNSRYAVMLAATLTLIGVGALCQTSAHAQAKITTLPTKIGTIAPDESTVALAKTLGSTVAVARQIQSIDADRETWTPAQRKLSSDFIYAARMAAGQPAVPGVPTLQTMVTPDASGRVRVIIHTSIAPGPDGLYTSSGRTALSTIKLGIGEAGGEILINNGWEITALVPLSKLEALAALKPITAIRTYLPPQLIGRSVRSAKPRALVPYVQKKRTRAEMRTAVGAALAQAGIPVDTFSLSGLLLGATDYNGTDTGVIGEGTTAHAVAAAYSAYGVSGYGSGLSRPIRIGVMSDDDKFLSNSQTSLDLPNVTDSSTRGTGATPSVTIAIDDTQNPAQTEDGLNTSLSGGATTGEGTAMMQIVHDMVPSAKIFFATASYGPSQFARNILLLRYKYNCDIICDDVGYADESVFSDAIEAQAVNQVVANGCFYFSSAGNSGHRSTYSLPNTSVANGMTASVWEGDFVDGGAVTQIGTRTVTGNVHAFASGVTYDTANYPATSMAVLFWGDSDQGSQSEYSLYGVATSGTTSAGTTYSGDSAVPFQYVGGVAAGTKLYILKKSGAAVKALHLAITEGSTEYNMPAMTYTTTGQTGGHSATLNGFGVAAVPATNNNGFGGPAAGAAFTKTSPSEFFSSDGPRTIFYNVSGGPNLSLTTNPYGFPVSAPTFTATGTVQTFAAGGVVRLQPAITAADGVTSSSAFSTSGGLNPFYGTSAAAPHAASIAGLVMSYSSSNSGVTGVPGLSINGGLLSVSDMHTVLQNSALDIEAAGYDPTTGYGIVMPAPAIAYLNGFLSSSPVAASTSATGETIAWTTRLPASTVVNYGTTPLLGTTYTGAAGATSHTATLSGLIPGTTYYYTITTGTATGSAAYTTPTAATFTTTATTPALALTGIALATSGGTTTATITVANNGSASSDVQVIAAKLGSGNTTTPLAKDLGAMAATASATFTLTFPAVASGRTVLTLSLTDGTGAVNNFTQRVTAP